MSGAISSFYQEFFSRPGLKQVVQVGANDGVMCDPLRKFLVKPGAFSAVLVEPIPYYFEKLRALYRGDDRVSVLNAACGPARGQQTLYFIDPAVADEMNGDGPPNDWAHGQGSFDRDIVHYWIEQNRFRGDHYVANIQRYHDAVKSIQVPLIRVAETYTLKRGFDTLLVIDAQGAEHQVLQGVDWKTAPPDYLVFEVDTDNAQRARDYVDSIGYDYLGSEHGDVLYIRRKPTFWAKMRQALVFG